MRRENTKQAKIAKQTKDFSDFRLFRYFRLFRILSSHPSSFPSAMLGSIAIQARMREGER
jgi:hypothetical protein